MAAQYISRNEFQEGMNDLYGRLTRYIDLRLDAHGVRIEAAVTRIEKMEATQAQLQIAVTRLEGTVAQLQTAQNQLQRDMGSVIAFQQTLMEAFRGFASDITKQMADGFARQEERINEILVRLDKLEKRTNPPEQEA